MGQVLCDLHIGSRPMPYKKGSTVLNGSTFEVLATIYLACSDVHCVGRPGFWEGKFGEFDSPETF